MVEQKRPVGRPKRQPLVKAQQAAAEEALIQDLADPVLDTNDVIETEVEETLPSWYIDPDRVVPEDELPGWNPTRTVFKFISPTPALIIRFSIPRRDRNGELILTQLGAEVRDEVDIKFRNGVVFVKDKTQVLLMLRHESYGGTSVEQTENADPLFWLDNYPAHEWETIKRRMKFITHEEGEHEA